MAASAALALGAVTACGGGDTPAAPPAATTVAGGSGYFVGTGPGGVGAAVDLQAHDAVTARAAEALLRVPAREGRPGLVVGVASVVNDGRSPVPLPRFVAVVDGGGATPLVAARSPGLGIPGAARIFPSPPLFVPAGGSATVYLVLRGARAEAVRSVKMIVRPGEPVMLGAHRR